jgi:hypothetical protein
VQNGSVRLSLTFVILSLLATAALGCNEAPLIRAADAGNPCLLPVLEYACHAQAATLPGCAADLDSGGPPLQQEEVLQGKSYPSGCTVIVYSPVPDQNEQCAQLGTCTCNGDDAGNYNWTCRN